MKIEIDEKAGVIVIEDSMELDRTPIFSRVVLRPAECLILHKYLLANLDALKLVQSMFNKYMSEWAEEQRKKALKEEEALRVLRKTKREILEWDGKTPI